MLAHLSDRVSGRVPRGHRRSKDWPRTRAAHLAAHPYCALCKGKVKLEVHHVLPFHLRPDLELEPSNLITLCEAKRFGVTCHQFVGHLGDYRLYNPDVVADARIWAEKLHVARIRLGRVWPLVPAPSV